MSLKLLLFAEIALMTNAERQKNYRDRLINDLIKYEVLSKKHLDGEESGEIILSDITEKRRVN